MLCAAGVLILDQTWPFQTSANQVDVPGASLSSYVLWWTIATQRLVDAQETVAELESSPGPRQRRPVARSIWCRSTAPTHRPRCPMRPPGQPRSTPSDSGTKPRRGSPPLPLGSGTRSAVHRTPSQRAAPSPTATHTLLDTHDTASFTYGGGARIADHVRPFHRAAMTRKTGSNRGCSRSFQPRRKRPTTRTTPRGTNPKPYPPVP